eukprot:5811921-Amphidinium_carterae.1
MFCEAGSYAILDLLNRTWQMAPAACGTSIRKLMPSDVTRCLARCDDPVVADCSGPIVVVVVVVAVSMVLIIVARRWHGRCQCVAQSRQHIELPDCKEALIEKSTLCLSALSLSRVQPGQYVRVTATEQVLLATCRDADLPSHDRLRCKGM